MIKLTKIQKIGLAVASVHLLIVFIGAADFHPWSRLGRVGRSVEYYGNLSGASSGYGFFAPGVGSQLRARFVANEKQSSIAETSLETGRSHESDIRIGNIVGWFWNDQTDINLKRSLAASWAGKIFGRYPTADNVVVHLDTYELVSMEEYADGKRSYWKPFYQAKFLRKASLDAN